MYGLVDPEDVLGLIEKDILVKATEMNRIKTVIAKYPDAMCYVYDTTTVLVSKTANSHIEEVVYTESEQGIIYAWPRTRSGNTYVYSNPPYYLVGVKNTAGFGMVPSPTIEAEMETDELCFKAVKEIRSKIKFSPPIDYI